LNNGISLPVQKIVVKHEHPQLGVLQNRKTYVSADVHVNLKKRNENVKSAVTKMMIMMMMMIQYIIIATTTYSFL